jgi:hypothetical protein
MRTIASSALTVMLGIWASPAFCADKDLTGVAQYDTKTEIDFSGTLVKVNEVASGNDFAGIYVTLQTKTDSFEVYLGPTAFIKRLGVPLRPGLKDFAVTGSKVKAAAGELVLAREVRVEKTAFLLRDSKGVPNWLWNAPELPTGF